MRLPWDRYDLILFDFDDTLVDFASAEMGAIAAVCRQFGRDVSEDLIAAFRTINRELWQRHDKGEIPMAAVFRQRFERFLGVLAVEGDADIANDTFLGGLAAHATPLPAVTELLAQLACRSVIGIVSNGHGRTQRTRVQVAGFAAHVHFYAISDEVGVPKPHPAIFAEAYRLSGLPPGRKTLMVGDNLTADIEGALAAGFDACWVHGGRDLTTCVAPTYAFASLADAAASHLFCGGNK